jgi:hypothetical protein
LSGDTQAGTKALMWRTKKIKFSPGKTTTREKRRITQHGGELALKRADFC